LPNIGGIKRITFCFLQTDNGASTLFNFIPKSIPFFFAVNPPNIPAQDIPLPIHLKPSEREKATILVEHH
jgi:hypothetical protein